MVNIIVYQGNHVFGVTLAVAIDARRCGGLYLFATREQDNEQYCGSCSSGNRDSPYDTPCAAVLIPTTLYIRGVYLFYYFVCIHIVMYIIFNL